MSTFKDVVSSRNYVILDTETTGLDRGSEIVQIAIIEGKDGTVLLDTLVKPKYDIPVQASRIHGITAETVANAPTWDVVMPQVRSILEGRDVVIYNASGRVRGPFIDLDAGEVERTLAVSAFGGFLVAQQAVKRMLPEKSGCIVFTGASASVKGYSQSAPFAMGKFALRGLAQSMARELHP